MENLGPQVIVNLINKQKSEKKLGDHFELLVKNLNNDQLKYVWFDFHKECAKMQWQNLSKLIDIIQKDID